MVKILKLRSSLPQQAKKPEIKYWTLVLLVGSFLIILVSQHKQFSFSPSSSHSFDDVEGDSFGMLPVGASPKPSGIVVAKEEDEKAAAIRRETTYGGEGDAKHLGGFTEFDKEGVSPTLWRYMIDWFGVKSILDVGCGRGISTSWFYLQGVKAQCVEGSNDAYLRNLLVKLASKDGAPVDKHFVQHDFSKGPWWPESTVDAVWAVEFLEHVSRHYHQNYIPTFKKAALVFATHSNWGGWHHVEIHDDQWWINKFEMYGLKYSADLTKKAREKAKVEKADRLVHTLMVFINPSVASRPEHAHLLAEPGCYKDRGVNIQCGEEAKENARAISTVLPDSFKPIPFKEDKQKEWEALLEENVDQKKLE